MSKHTEKGVCGYCAITVCNKCVINNKYCHGNDNGKSICSSHSKNNRIVNIDSNRIVIAKGGLKATQHNLFTEFVSISKENGSISNIFNSLYTEFNNTAHYYEIYDRNDNELWKSIKLIIIFFLLY